MLLNTQKMPNIVDTKRSSSQGKNHAQQFRARSDAEILSVINQDIQKTKIADLLVVSNDGTSGYKTGESKFNETYY